MEYSCNAEKLNRTDCLIIALIDDDIALRGTDGIDWEQTNALPALLQPYLTSIDVGCVDDRFQRQICHMERAQHVDSVSPGRCFDKKADKTLERAHKRFEREMRAVHKK